MAKTLVPHKVVIEFEDGGFVNGVLIYKINDSGVIGRYRSVGIKNAGFDKSSLNGILQKFNAHAKQAEGIDG
ncbi:MAG: hypothetical protein A2Y00_05545 [Omnitrophica WOR_2 bacterium GWF2_43_52]|nr:MAG: hypothetical protein A2062_00195 [Omnitrophica WOR_2 bacterium GWA2_44_7]OGX16386.1 MAG: hypothetical protein A2Y01_07415 [Omnitrophica WOR_2 bacterium GWC2_44_8]OGX20564.1 MAG: hypothetical protein A2Y00_05545 [Omnitrophica WOR_2 bacterium GWF2_43_52]HAH21620.1 hypothetical protein [Candidatus Omnitrophota bacterium]HBG64213.1 hypothetical protein [Candidatus Omnitrophota bacterium]